MSPGQTGEQEPIGVLLGRLVEDARSLAKAELALARTDFYRRIGRARTGALLCLIGAIMGQAAAVTFLVTLSFVLTPWIGRLGGAATSVLLGIVLAVALIRIGVRKLVLVVEDPDGDDDDDAGTASGSPIDELFEKVRQRSQEARNQLVETVGETQARLHPQALIADLAELVVDQAQAMSHRVVDAVRQKPVRTAAGLAVVLLLLFRPPLHRIGSALMRATRDDTASLRNGRRREPSTGEDEETSA